MSAALINRSLTNIRTELEFLQDSEVIDEKLMAALSDALPPKYSKGMAPWSTDKLSAEKEPVAELSQNLEKTKIQDDIKEPANPTRVPPRKPAGPIGYCKALYNYEAQEADDLTLAKDDKLAVVEHLSPDWWKGYKQGNGAHQTGVFPSNYVSVISESEFESSREKAPLEKASYSEKASYESVSPSPSAPPYDQVVPQPTYPQYPQGGQYNQGGQYSQGYQQNGYGQMQPSYGGYAQYPPPSTNYYPQQQMQQQGQEQQLQQTGDHKSHEHVKKFGGKLGNAAIFGAGATIGSNIVNSIF